MAKHIEYHKSMGAAGDVVLIRLLEKRLIDPVTVQETARELSAVVDGGSKKIVLSLPSLEVLGSASLNSLVVLNRKIDAASGALRICSLQVQIREVFKITKLDRIFVIKGTEDEALAGF